tara:strand:- start:133 stop:576 length:444 start_codon:yes stop_codon:yes gene_type:complete
MQELMNEPASMKELDLSLVAARAAVEADYLSNRKESKLDNLKLIADYLSSGAQLIPNDGDTIRFLEKPITLDVIASAFSASQTHFSSIEELRTQTEDLAEKIERIDQSIDNDALFDHLRDFCIALSNYSMASRSEYFDDQRNSGLKR